MWQSLVLVLALGWVYQAAPAAEAKTPAAGAAAVAPNVMALEALRSYPDMDAALKLVRNNEPELRAYLSDPDTVCTFFMPTGQALQNSLKILGKYAGKAAQNVTLSRSTLNYHLVPGVALTAEEIGNKSTRALTRANETIYFWREKGQPRIYARPDLAEPLNRTNVRAGKCIVHTIDRALVPLTALDMVQGWLEELGTMPKLPPKSQWAPQQQPLPDSIEAGGSKAAGTAAPAPAPARSCGSSSSMRVVLTAALAAAAAVVLG